MQHYRAAEQEDHTDLGLHLRTRNPLRGPDFCGECKGGTMLAESIFRTSMRVTIETVCRDTFGKFIVSCIQTQPFFYSKRKKNAHKPFLLDPTVHRHYISVNWKMSPSMNPRVAVFFPVCLLSYALTPASRGPRELPRILSARFVGDLQHLVLQEAVYDFQIGLRVCWG
jgi:hypothetical protein